MNKSMRWFRRSQQILLLTSELYLMSCVCVFVDNLYCKPAKTSYVCENSLSCTLSPAFADHSMTCFGFFFVFFFTFLPSVKSISFIGWRQLDVIIVWAVGFWKTEIYSPRNWDQFDCLPRSIRTQTSVNIRFIVYRCRILLESRGRGLSVIS